MVRIPRQAAIDIGLDGIDFVINRLLAIQPRPDHHRCGLPDLVNHTLINGGLASDQHDLSSRQPPNLPVPAPSHTLPQFRIPSEISGATRSLSRNSAAALLVLHPHVRGRPWGRGMQWGSEERWSEIDISCLIWTWAGDNDVETDHDSWIGAGREDYRNGSSTQRTLLDP
jgi:hypothetical protein